MLESIFKQLQYNFKILFKFQKNLYARIISFVVLFVSFFEKPIQIFLPYYFRLIL